MATVSNHHHHHHAMRPYPLCHHQPLDGSAATTTANNGGGGLVGGTAVPTVPYFYPTTNQVSVLIAQNNFPPASCVQESSKTCPPSDYVEVNSPSVDG